MEPLSNPGTGRRPSSYFMSSIPVSPGLPLFLVQSANGSSFLQASSFLLGLSLMIYTRVPLVLSNFPLGPFFLPIPIPLCLPAHLETALYQGPTVTTHLLGSKLGNSKERKEFPPNKDDLRYPYQETPQALGLQMFRSQCKTTDMTLGLLQKPATLTLYY